MTGIRKRLLLFLCIGPALSVNGLLQLLRIWQSAFPIVIDAGTFWTLATIVGFTFLILWFVITVALFRQSTRARHMISQVMLFGFTGAITSPIAFIHDLNIELDTTDGVFETVQVMNKPSAQAKNETQYYLVLKNLESGEWMDRISVNYDVYSLADRGDQLLLQIHHGFLGYRWLDEHSFQVRARWSHLNTISLSRRAGRKHLIPVPLWRNHLPARSSIAVPGY